MGEHILESEKMEKCMERVFLNGMMEKNMRENL